MARFNPFARVKGTYGAPMGRDGHNADSWDGFGKLYVRHCGGDGYYDRGGAYWGHSRVYAVWTRGGGFCAYVEARDSGEALKIVRAGPMPEGWSATEDGSRLCGRYLEAWKLTGPAGYTARISGTYDKAVAAAEVFGNVDLCVGNDGQIHA